MSVLDHRDYGAKGSSPLHYEADVIVVGTGAGGASAGAELAEAGFDVLFVEEGGWHPTSSFNPYLEESIPRLYRDAGATMMLGSPPIMYAEGRCVGGTTVVNGGMTWRTPERIHEEWVHAMGTEALSYEAMTPLYERVEERISARPQHEVSVGRDNALMRDGAAKMGWDYQTNNRNQKDCVGSNNCILGCPTEAKQSTLVSYMPRAMKAGASCLTEVRVDKLVIEAGRCVGIAGRGIDPLTRRGGRKVIARAPVVIISCGAIQTPFLLLRHKLGRASKQLGRNFTCHPNAKVVAIYPDEVEGWKGVSQLGQIREFHEDGFLFAENMVPPGPLSALLHQHGARAWDTMSDYNRMVVSGVLVEDSGSGRIRRGPFGAPIVRYDITARDFENFCAGIRRLGEMHFAMGAEKVLLPFQNMLEATDVDQLSRIDPRSIKVRDLELFTPHLMGSCRMGATEESSVVGLDGQVWDLPGCYVADASIFPGPIGVNPQVTIMAMSTRIAHGLANDLKVSKVA